MTQPQGNTEVPSPPLRCRLHLFWAQLRLTGRVPWGRGDPAPYAAPKRVQPDLSRAYRNLCFPLSPFQPGPEMAKLGETLSQGRPLFAAVSRELRGVRGLQGSTQSRGPWEEGERRSRGPERDTERRSARSLLLPRCLCPPLRSDCPRESSPMKRMGKVMKSKKTCGTTLSASTKQPLLRTPWSTR